MEPALYEIVAAGEPMRLPLVDPLKYQRPSAVNEGSPELMTVKLRYKHPEGEESRLLSFTVQESPGRALGQATLDARW